MTKLTQQTNLSIEQTKALLKYNFMQFIKYGPGNYVPLSMWGHAGVGKTTLVTQVIAELVEELSKERGKKVTIGFRSFQMSAMQPFELSGYPFIDTTTYANKSVQSYATPDFLVEAEKYDYFFCFFDEWNRARTEMHNAFMGYIDGRGVNGHAIPKNMFCVSAANPQTDDSSYGAITDVGDQAILDRLIHVNVVPTSEEFLTYLYREKKAHSSVQSFLTENKDNLPDNSFTGITGTIRDTNRGLVDVSKMIGFVAEEKTVMLRKALIEAVAKGIIGDSKGQLFADRFGKCELLTTPEELLAGKKLAFEAILSAVGKDENGENRLDQVTKVVENMIRLINDPMRKDFTKAKIKNLNKFLDIISHDQAQQIVTKGKFRASENDSGLKDRTVETLQVTSDVVENPTWR